MSRAHLNAISVERGEEDELVLPIVARVSDDVVQRDPAQNFKEKSVQQISPPGQSSKLGLKKHLLLRDFGKFHNPFCSNLH